MAALPSFGRPTVVAVSGFGGAGKSTFARRLAKAMGEAFVIEGDDFWRPEYDVRSADWCAVDRGRLVAEVLEPVRRGRVIAYRKADFASGALGEPVRLPPTSVVIVEGIGLFHPSVMRLFDLTVWLDTPLVVAMARGMERDRREDGVNHDLRWREVWGPNDRDFFVVHDPRGRADLVVTP